MAPEKYDIVTPDQQSLLTFMNEYQYINMLSENMQELEYALLKW